MGHHRVLGVLAAIAAMNCSAAAAASHRARAPSQAEPRDGLLAALALAQARQEEAERDQFVDTKIDARGKSFSIVCRPQDGGVAWGRAEGCAYWTYEDGKLTYTLMADPAGGAGSQVEKLWIYSIAHPSAAYLGENSFGVKRRVAVTRWEIYGIAPLSWPSTFEFPIGRGRSSTTTGMRFSIDARGAEARAIAASVYVKIEGQVDILPSGSSTACSTDHDEPTIDNPADNVVVSCWAAVRLSRVSFIDRRNGTVVKEWTGPQVGAAGESAQK